MLVVAREGAEGIRRHGRVDSTKWITERGFGRSRTSYNLDDLRKAVQPLHGVGVQRLLDIRSCTPSPSRCPSWRVPRLFCVRRGT